VKKIIYWFRGDLRLTDNPAFLKACSDGESLLPIYIHHPREKADAKWGFSKKGSYSQQFLQESILDLKKQLIKNKSDLLEFSGLPEEIIPELIKILGDAPIYCQTIQAPEEQGDIDLLTEQKIVVKQFWQSSMIDPKDLPFALGQMPDMFTAFRQKIENAKLRFAKPASRPSTIPPLPNELNQIDQSQNLNNQRIANKKDITDSTELIFKGGETLALQHIEQYFERRLPDTYKQTRNQLLGMDYSTKFSPWLAHGCCSARYIAQRLSQYEKQHGANESTYWIWFELLWRDYFSFLPFKYGKKLFHPRGLTDQPVGKLNVSQFNQWINGQTKESFINAAMTELSSTGFLSNRMRQIVASYWIYDMGGDWRAGAAWFESQLIDYDVYSNQGNWLYIAGRGTDPRGGRPFNVAKQMRDHDPDGLYRQHWL
jgi:deoxyribodipyrimidine photo-lyase